MSIICNLPKADCHVHANALASDTDILRLAHKHRVTLPTPHIGADGTRHWHDHTGFHQTYDAAVKLLREPEDIKDVTRAALLRMSSEHCLYVELLASGLNNFHGGDPIPVFTDNMLAIISAIREARERDGIHAYISLTAKRHLKPGTNRAHELLDALEAFRRSHPDEAATITGFNMAGDEQKGNITDFHEVFARAFQMGLGCACHAGEMNPVEDVRAALRLPGVTRIGHALSAIHDPLVMREMHERDTLVEQLLTVNETLHRESMRGPEDHPIRAFAEAGLCIGLGSDDPGMLKACSIGSEYHKAAAKYGFEAKELLSFTVNSIRHAFAPESVKQSLLVRLQKYARDKGLAMRPEAFASRPRLPAATL